MATVLNTYKCHYHFEQGNPSKHGSPQYVNYLEATASDYASLRTVLSNNSLLRVGTLVFDSVQEIGRGDVAFA